MKLALKKYLADRGISQAELARRMGHKTDIYIRRWASGRNFPRESNLEKLCEVLNCSPRDLLHLEAS